jgi:LmbE family N-acetylglucosaminyl deacetylase
MMTPFYSLDKLKRQEENLPRLTEGIQSCSTTKPKMNRITDVLLVISHPDDDAIFAGQLQMVLGSLEWSVVCVTHERKGCRGAELLAWQQYLGTDSTRIHLLGYPDDPQDLRDSHCSIDPANVGLKLRQLNITPRIVVTHNDVGEYGHPHHIMTHHVVRETYSQCPILFFGHGKKRQDLILAADVKWSAMKAFYKSQAKAIRPFFGNPETFLRWPEPNLTPLAST